MGQDVHNIADFIAMMREGFGRMERRLEDIVPRRDFSNNTIRQWLGVVRNFYGCSCPCCRKVKIIDVCGGFIQNQVHLDHFNGRERNGAEDGWPVCKECNSRLERAEYKESKRPHFTVFHDYRRDICVSARSTWRSRRRASGPVTDQRQKALFE